MKKIKLICRAAVAVVFIISCNVPVDDMNGYDEAVHEVPNMPEVPAIIKADPSVNWPGDLMAFVGQKLSDINLPGNGTNAPSGTFTWAKPSDSVGSIGTQYHNVTFTPDDTVNYNIVKQDAAVTVISVKMVKIPAGTFVMGNADPLDKKARPQHQVTLSGFYMSECLVTQDLYKMIIGSNFFQFYRPVVGENRTPDKLPAERVSWYDAVQFCNMLSTAEELSPAYQLYGSTDPSDWGAKPVINYDTRDKSWDAVEIVPGSNGYRLPTEAQWEYACRAGTTTAYNTGDTLSDDTGWYDANSYGRTHQVGLKPANAWGLYDMHGNVMEWCWDWYDVYPAGPVTDPQADEDNGNYSRVTRGGAFTNFDSALDLNSAHRGAYMPYIGSYSFGFRLVRPLA